MLNSKHIYDPRFKKDPRGVLDQLHIMDRIIDKNEALIHSSGAPMTLWKYFPFGPECNCEKKSRCNICYGSGYLNGYQKYGYYTYTFGANSLGRNDQYGLKMTSNILQVKIPNSQIEALVLNSGTTGYIETNPIPISNAVSHPYIKSQIFTPPGTSIMYSYSIDRVNYTSIVDLQQSIDIPEAEYVVIRLTLSRDSISIPSPAVNVFRYRIQIKTDYGEYIPHRDQQSREHVFNHISNIHEDRFEIEQPAFIASKQVINRGFTTTQEGEVVDYRPRYWALPDVKIGERDIGMFLVGNHKDQRFEFENLTISEHGENQRVLHTNWVSRFIFDKDDVLGIIYTLD